jgi:hypothetical protein
VARGKPVTAAKAQMPLPDAGVDIPARAEHALTKKTLIKEWGLRPWELARLSVSDLQDMMLAEHAESYIKHQQQEQQRNGGMRSSRNSESYQDYQDNMEERFGGFN